MSALSTAQRVRADELLDTLLDLPEEARADYLAGRRDDDPVVLREVESLLRAAQECGDFLATPARLSTEAPTEPILPDMRVGAGVWVWSTRLCAPRVTSRSGSP
jgi:hypothetical protein